MSFQFRYQRVLDVRNLEEDREKAKLAEIQQRLIREKKDLNELEEEIEQLFQRESEARSGRQKAGNIIEMRRYANLLENKIEEQQQVVSEWREKLEEQRQELIDASQRRQVLEKLKENEFEEFQKEVRKDIQRESDEVATQQYHREDT